MKLFNSILSLMFITLFSTFSFGQDHISTNADQVAINGYDLVAYFTNYKAVEGTKAHAVKLNKATYHFSSSENAAAFKANPEAYLPAYGGYCAFAMAMKGATVPADPETFKIRDGKLYLFFNDLYEGKPFNTIIPWNGEEATMIVKADTNWKKH